jgi:hypothetical protein
MPAWSLTSPRQQARLECPDAPVRAEGGRLLRPVVPVLEKVEPGGRPFAELGSPGQQVAYDLRVFSPCSDASSAPRPLATEPPNRQTASPLPSGSSAVAMRGRFPLFAYDLPGWRNGRRGGLRSHCRKACRFDSCPRHLRIRAPLAEVAYRSLEDGTRDLWQWPPCRWRQWLSAVALSWRWIRGRRGIPSLVDPARARAKGLRWQRRPVGVRV